MPTQKKQQQKNKFIDKPRRSASDNAREENIPFSDQLAAFDFKLKRSNFTHFKQLLRSFTKTRNK